MNLFNIILIFFNIININAFKNIKIRENYFNKLENKSIGDKKYINNNKNNKNENNIIKSKINGFIEIIRPNNLIPVFLLCFTGGWIIHPSFQYLTHSLPFFISIINTLLIMSLSMIINDIYDLNMDKINSPDRPLVIGKISIIEAIIFSLFLFGSIEYLTLFYLPDNLKLIIQLALFQISIYTPILKRIIFIKNIACSSLVSFSIFFTGLSVSDTLIELNKNFGILAITINIIFFGSLCNEILLDIRDLEGDKKYNIITIPVLFGKDIAWIIASFIALFNIFANSFSIIYIYKNIDFGLILLIIFSPLLFNLYQLKKYKYSEESIINYMKFSNLPLFILLIYICKISLI